MTSAGRKAEPSADALKRKMGMTIMALSWLSTAAWTSIDRLGQVCASSRRTTDSAIRSVTSPRRRPRRALHAAKGGGRDRAEGRAEPENLKLRH